MAIKLRALFQRFRVEQSLVINMYEAGKAGSVKSVRAKREPRTEPQGTSMTKRKVGEEEVTKWAKKEW